ncbi:uncharacterized protein Z520_09811 [Fonsecaea multimorphosa CBS 102226]|uniref:Extracellular membrane protein CFEM domain-containing protein n=1 Tax=Fonsecaea multimorphosa CBS 102226 TaxID=1442371 RepID=A0A0D2GY24_9EURO|nr:uncharacterized protein Z520_09811 [Fonsecaea multimorphosa CBS 102226]KIX94425.1 hypothetical protein Z520_09811 [Fonsecaea multimorphosa CBS 102226]OAL20006.1 hypothetical protein AYO22_09156 [Fonsecaea multimorphosa]
MQNKVVFLSAILACGSASFLSDQNSKLVDDGLDNNQIRSPLFTQDILALPNLPDELRKRATDTDLCFTINRDDCEDSMISFLACAADTNSGECVLGAECVITPKECLPEVKLQARQDGGGSPFDPELSQRSPDDVEPTLSILVDSNAVDEVPLETRQDARISDEIQAAIPAEVRNAMLNNPDAAESLANVFSGGSKPQWFARLPASVTNYYATITPPPTMTGYVIKDTTNDPERQSLDNWVASVQYYKDLIASASLSAASESDYARRMSRAAEEKSKWASEEEDGQLQTSAWEQSRLAASASTHAAAESSYAASASRTVYGQKAQIGQGSTADMQLAFGSSIVGAVVCLGLAFAL